ncbi:MAG TPA: SLC13 family permease [Jatrophihabitantaceae bacterium]|nr:SLC13 family permease [Jatrophihabitantaceae bacterium]
MTDVLTTLREIGPTVGFLATILVLGHLCEDAGVFAYLGSVAARVGGRSSPRLLATVVAIAAGVTVVLTLDATVVLLTPVVLATTARLRVRSQPHVFACVRLANSGSLLLPVSNLTNLLAFSRSGLSFGRFAALMALPWVVVCVAEWGLVRIAFGSDLRTDHEQVDAAIRVPRFALAVVGVTLVGFVATSAASMNPVWAALAGCVALLVPRIAERTVRPAALIRAASPGFCAAVLVLAVVVDEVMRHGAGTVLEHVFPTGTGFVALLAIAAIAAVLANLVNNLPATLALMPLTAASPAHVLAVLVGVNVGPNATYPGSLATLLWRRVVPRDERPSAQRFHGLGLLTVVPLLALACGALTVALETIGTA